MRGSGWIEVRVPAAVGADDLAALLDDPDLTGAWEEHGVLRLYWPKARWEPGRLTRVSSAFARLGGDPNAIAVETLTDVDWNAAWAKSVMPIRIGRRLIVRPSWAPVGLLPGDIELILDPKQAFGTGHHATTRLLLEWLEDVISGGERVLDVGTGSGLLAMAALRLGAARAVGLDADPVAIECAREAAGMNGFGGELRLEVARFGGSAIEPADVVLANLDRATILATLAYLKDTVRPRGVLLLSGLLLEDETEVEAALASYGGLIAERREADGWVALSIGFRA